MSRVATRRPDLNLRLAGVALACASALLASCGGGDRKSYFTPDNIVSFGDENSVIVADTASALVDNTLPTGVATDLPGLTYTAKDVGVGASAICTHDTTQAKACSTDAGGAFTPVDTTYRVLTQELNWVVKFELDAGATNQRTTIVDYACSTPKTWVQIVASAYGKGYNTACPTARGGAVSHATLGAKTDDVINQINAHRGSLGSKTVVTIMVGQNDIVELFNSVLATADAQNELQARAARMASAVRSVIDTGAKVVLALTPDLSQAPVGASDPTRMAALVKAYNDRLYITGLGNVSGRSLAGVNPESYTKPGIRSGSDDYYTTPLCDAAAVLRPDGSSLAAAGDDEKLLYCTSQYYTAGASAGTHVWADAKRPAPLLHNLIGVTVYNRAREQF